MEHSGDIVTLAYGQYRLVEQLAASAYGVVWRAQSCTAGYGAAVALKLVNRAQMARAEPVLRAAWRACAEREIAFLSQLAPWDARHIVRLLDYGEHEGLPAIALELLGGDLASHMAALAGRGGRVGLCQSLVWLAQINGALAKVHGYGWRYLDLKPANLLVDDRGATLKLADFGTSRSLADNAAHSYSGTASWQAPEQFFAASDDGYLTDERTDYFALGALFFYLVTNGATLRYSSACADAWRTHGPAGAARLQQACGGAPPPVLLEAEAIQFLGCAALGNEGDPRAALALLRALIAPQREDRPRHALAISRMIAAAQAAPEPAMRRAA